MPRRPRQTPTTDLRFLATAARGTEPLLADELRALGIQPHEQVPGGVLFDADLAAAMRACLWLRTATRVQLLLGEANVANTDQIYDAVRAMPLAPWFHPDHTIAVWAHLNDSRFTHSHYVSLKVKDAVVDAMRDEHGRRADVDTNTPDVAISVYVLQGTLRVFLALQGDSLNQRGYRTQQVAAPLRETLAAALVTFSGWPPGERPFHDPMCGSGTVAIEAALMATDAAPGLGRHFGFEGWPVFHGDLADAWKTTLDEARQRRRSADRGDLAPILASDIDRRAVDIARANARRAGVSDVVKIFRADARELQPLDPPGDFVMNAPYGERIGGSARESRALHEDLGAAVKPHDGHRMTLLSTPHALRGVRMRPDERVRVFNGRLECEMARYLIGRRHAVAASSDTASD